MSSSVFISRSAESGADLTSLLREAGFEVQCRSLITTEHVALPDTLPASDWIFFSSANGVRHFYAQKPRTGHQKLAAIGQSTAAALREHGEISYTGNGAEIAESAAEFARIAGHETVLFPGAEDSLRSIQSVFPPKQAFTLVCYRTIENPAEIAAFDVLVFSSPSNVRSYLRRNILRADQKCVAYGPSTARALREGGALRIFVPESLDNQGLLHAIKMAAVS